MEKGSFLPAAASPHSYQLFYTVAGIRVSANQLYKIMGYKQHNSGDWSRNKVYPNDPYFIQSLQESISDLKRGYEKMQAGLDKMRQYLEQSEKAITDKIINTQKRIKDL